MAKSKEVIWNERLRKITAVNKLIDKGHKELAVKIITKEPIFKK